MFIRQQKATCCCGSFSRSLYTRVCPWGFIFGHKTNCEKQMSLPICCNIVSFMPKYRRLMCQMRWIKLTGKMKSTRKISKTDLLLHPGVKLCGVIGRFIHMLLKGLAAQDHTGQIKLLGFVRTGTLCRSLSNTCGLCPCLYKAGKPLGGQLLIYTSAPNTGGCCSPHPRQNTI